MKYVSTRGDAPALSFEEVVLTGLASDGGLYVPEQWPSLDPTQWQALQGKSFEEVAFAVMLPFIGDSIPPERFKTMIQQVYARFDHPAVAPLIQVDHNEYILELFHGPTLAFKDFALQLLGQLFDYFLAKKKQKVVIMGATSGDTGSAAIEGCRHSEWVDIFILHPHGKVSEVQRKQMTTVDAANVHNIAVQGTFDDCQTMVKESFADQGFLNGRPLVAVNSINWARIMAQVTYYAYASLNLGAPNREIIFSVPTGNFGDVFAGYVGKQMGLPIKQLMVATNGNDILHRTIHHNKFNTQPIKHTLSPSMDITISSNFERLLFDAYQRDAEGVKNLMAEMKNGEAEIASKSIEFIRKLFGSCAVSDQETVATIKATFAKCHYLLDPHTAIGVKANEPLKHSSTPTVVLATAHPVKFEKAVIEAGLNYPELPLHLKGQMERPERVNVLDNDIEVVQSFIQEALA